MKGRIRIVKLGENIRHVKILVSDMPIAASTFSLKRKSKLVKIRNGGEPLRNWFWLLIVSYMWHCSTYLYPI